MCHPPGSCTEAKQEMGSPAVTKTPFCPTQLSLLPTICPAPLLPKGHVLYSHDGGVESGRPRESKGLALGHKACPGLISGLSGHPTPSQPTCLFPGGG